MTNRLYSDARVESSVETQASVGAWPAGPVTSTTADRLLEMLIEELEVAGPLDGVLANLHGAMVADDRPDMEADTIEAVRSVVGDVPVVAVVDFHANPTVRFVEATDVVIGYDTYPTLIYASEE